MLFPSDRLINIPVMGLQTGSELARTKSALIDPSNLKILAYELSGHRLEQQPSLLLTEDIREISDLGIIIDSSDEFISVDDVIKIQEVYALHFSLFDKVVKDENNNKLGKVIDYSMEPNSFIVKQLIVKRPLLKSFSDTQLIIDRTQIIEVNDTTIIIKHDEREPVPAQRAAKAFANPFRGTSPQSEATTLRAPKQS
jgi:uncharacterized protein YrrD